MPFLTVPERMLNDITKVTDGATVERRHQKKNNLVNIPHILAKNQNPGGKILQKQTARRVWTNGIMQLELFNISLLLETHKHNLEPYQDKIDHMFGKLFLAFQKSLHQRKRSNSLQRHIWMHVVVMVMHSSGVCVCSSNVVFN